jgi:hypothetical protein
VALGVAILLAAAVGGAVAVLWGGRGADEASVEEAVRRFRGDRRDGSSGSLTPEAGVYSYRGRGSEHLSVLGAAQEWGPRLPVTVSTTEAGCWTFRVDYSTHHVQETTYCATDHGLEERGGRTEQRFDFGAFAVDDTQVFTCDPPGQTIRVAARRGDSWRQSCTGRSIQRGTTVTSAGTNTFLGRVRLRIAGRTMDAYRYRIRRTLRGDQSGTEENAVWYDVRTALPLRVVHDIRVESPSPIGAVVYTEQGEYEMTSTTPRR